MRRPLAWWEFVAGLVTAVALILLVGLTWEAGQSALLPPPVTHTPRRPPFRGHPELYPPPLPLLDLPGVSLVANSAACGSSPLLLVLLVMSHPSHASLRDAHRSQASWEVLDALGARRVFFLADSTRSKQPKYRDVPMAEVLEESGRERDLVVADFQDHYRNLSYKHALALSWATRFCPTARYLLKMDDDIMVDVWGLAQSLQRGLTVDRWGQVRVGSSEGRRLDPRETWMAGMVQQGLVPERKGSSKWHVTLAEYPEHFYPKFLAGWAYVATQNASQAVVKAAGNTKPFWIDDVYMTGMVAKEAGVPRYGLNHHYSLMKEAATCCLEESQTQGWTKHSSWPRLAPLCGLLVVTSEKNVSVLQEWLRSARVCHEGGRCPSLPADSTCPPTHLHRGVGTVIPLS